jgi:hypothetical protein
MRATKLTKWDRMFTNANNRRISNPSLNTTLVAVLAGINASYVWDNYHFESIFMKMGVTLVSIVLGLILGLSISFLGFFLFEIFDHFRQIRMLKIKEKQYKIIDPRWATALRLSREALEKGEILHPFYIWNSGCDFFDD